MTRPSAPVLLLAMVAASCSSSEPAPAPPPPPPSAAPTAAPTPPAPVLLPTPPSQAVLLTGMLPAAPEAELARARCLICHDENYLVQQRLSPEAWTKTVTKMQKFGSPLTDEEAKQLASWLASLYPPELPMRADALVERPAAGLPSPM